MDEQNLLRLKLNKTTVRTLSPAETSQVGGGYYTEWCTGWTQCYETCYFYSCQDPHSVQVPHTCFSGCW